MGLKGHFLLHYSSGPQKPNFGGGGTSPTKECNFCNVFKVMSVPNLRNIGPQLRSLQRGMKHKISTVLRFLKPLKYVLGARIGAHIMVPGLLGLTVMVKSA